MNIMAKGKVKTSDKRSVRDVKLDELAGLLNEFDVNTMGALVKSLKKSKQSKKDELRDTIERQQEHIDEQKDTIDQLNNHISKLIDRLDNKL